MDWQLTSGILAAIAAILAALVKLVPPVRSAWMAIGDRFRETADEVDAAREMRTSLRNMRRVSAIRSTIITWTLVKNAQRGLLLIANNGGEAWKGQGPLFLSNAAQCAGAGEDNTQDSWQQWKCDAWYVQFLGTLLECHNRKAARLLIPETDVEGELRRAYDAQGTVASVVFPFFWEPGGVLWYVSLNFGRKLTLNGEPHPMTNEERQEYVSRARKIANDEARCRGLIDQLRGAYMSAG